MLACLSSVTFDPFGHVELDVLPSSAADDRRRRINRVATLDGGAVFSDAGFSHADRTITLRWMADDATQAAAVQRMAELYTRLVLSIDGAVYSVAPDLYTPGLPEARLTLLVASKLST